jgi:hypothetical protein
MNVKKKAVELRTSKHTTDPGALQRGEDFVNAFSLGFDPDDAIALLRIDDLVSLIPCQIVVSLLGAESLELSQKLCILLSQLLRSSESYRLPSKFIQIIVLIHQ